MADDSEVNDFLEHFGVRGMKWGQKKDRSRQGKADKLQRQADRRPTRGNVRTAQRAQRQADHKRPMSDVTRARLMLAGGTAVLGILGVAGGTLVGRGLANRNSTIDINIGDIVRNAQARDLIDRATHP